MGCAKTDTVAGGSNNNATPGPDQPAFLIRVQSSFGDIQQVEANVASWLIDGVDRRPFDRKVTPFDIPVAAGDFMLQLVSEGPGPRLKIQVLKEGAPVGFLQSKNVCVYGQADGTVEIKNCMVGLR